MESHLRVASIFARRWSTHETRDFSRRRFEEFASVLMKEMPAYYAVGLIPPDRSHGWIVPPDVPLYAVALDPKRAAVLDETRQFNQAVFSEPFDSAQGATTVYAALALMRGSEFLGTLLVDFRTKALIEDCFHERIRMEFQFMVQDSDQVLFSSNPKELPRAFLKAPIKARVQFPVRNRTWQLDMMPRKETAARYGWSASLPLPLLGIVLSVGLSVLVFMLLRHVAWLRMARDRQATLSRKVLLAQEEERARISRELHDELGQQLTALRLEMGWLRTHLSSQSPQGVGAYKNVVTLIEQATEELRHMCRGLRPALLDDLGLEPAVTHLFEEYQRRLDCDIEASVRIGEYDKQISATLALCTYRILQESLNNVSRHAKASKVFIRLTASRSGIIMQVVDNGCGFDINRLGAMRGWGLQGMQERAHLVDGEVEIQSTIGAGTQIIFRAPYSSREKEPLV